MNPFRKIWLHTAVITASVIGYGWVYWNLKFDTPELAASMPDVCLLRRVAGIPCPSCGSTHAVMQLFRGHFLAAWLANPLGYVLALGMLLLPIWALLDLATKRQTLTTGYKFLESTIKRRWVAIPLVLLIAANWAWNLLKYAP